MFSNVFKKDFIEATVMKSRRKLQHMQVDPYPNTILHCGLKRREQRETTDPILEEVMMYSVMIEVECLTGMADIINMVDRMVLEALEQVVKEANNLHKVNQKVGEIDTRVKIMEEWKQDIMEYMRDVREAQGGIRGRLSEVEACLTQLQAVVVGMSRELEMLGDMARHQSELLQIQQELILAMDMENQRRIGALERRMDPRGKTLGNPIIIDLDEDEMMLVKGLGVMRQLIPINDTLDGLDE